MKFYPSITVAQDTGNKPCMVKIANDPKAPESIRGKTVTGRCEWHGYQGVVDNEAGQEVWRGKMHEGPNAYGKVTIGSTVYGGETVPGPGQDDRAIQAAALSDAKAQAAKMAAATPAKKTLATPAAGVALKARTDAGRLAIANKDFSMVQFCPHCGMELIDASCPDCGSDSYEDSTMMRPGMSQMRRSPGLSSLDLGTVKRFSLIQS